MRRRFKLGLIFSFLLIALQGSASPVPPPGYVGSYVWHGRGVWFGGFSALEIADDGLHFTAVSDRGRFTTGTLARDALGVIIGAQASKMQVLKGRANHPIMKSQADSEGLAIAPDGTAYVSFEGVARVLRYAVLGGPADPLPRADGFTAFDNNASLEALAIDKHGWLYTLPERSANPWQPFPVYVFRNGAWDQPFTIPRTGTFVPVAADFGPDNRLYILERQFRGLMGFGSRVRRFTLSGDKLTREENLLQSPANLHDNLEGLAVWRDAGGDLRLTMVSDNNFIFLQRTEFVEYRVPD